MTAEEKMMECNRKSEEIYAKCEATFAKCRETFARCDECIRYLQDDTELKRMDEKLAAQRKLISESAALMKEARDINDHRMDQALDLLEKRLQIARNGKPKQK